MTVSLFISATKGKPVNKGPIPVPQPKKTANEIPAFNKIMIHTNKQGL